MNQIKQLAGQTAVYGAGTILPKLLNWGILTPFYTRTFVGDDVVAFGAITELYAYVVILNVIITFGMETGFFRFSQDKGQFKSVYTTSLLVVFILAVLFVAGIQLFIEPISEIIRYEAHTKYITWLSLIIALDCLAAIPFAKLRKENRAKRFSSLKLINVIVHISLIIFCLSIWPQLYEQNPEAWYNQLYNPELGVGYVFLVNLISSSIVFALISPEFRHIGGRLSRKILVDLLRFSMPLVVVGIAGSINEVADKIIIKFWLPDQENAMHELSQYGAAYRVAVIMTLFVQMFRYAFEPFLFAKGKSQGTGIYAKVMEVFVAVGLIVFLATLCYLDAVKIFLGPDYHEALDIVPIVLMANLFLGIFYSLSLWYKLTDMTKYAAILALGGTVITITGNLVLLPIFGVIGSAWAHLLCYGSMMVASYLLGQRHYKVPYNVKEIVSFVVLAVALYLLSIWIEPNTQLLKYAINTVILAVFIVVINQRTKLFVILFGKKEIEIK